MKKLIFFLTLVVLIASCKTEVPYPDLSYKCECGTVQWDTTSLDLTDSHWISTATAETDLGLVFDLGKDYYTTAKIDIDGEQEPHHLNMKISLPDVTMGVQNGLGAPIFYDFAEGIFGVEIEEVNYNSISVIDYFAVNAGNMTITSELGSITDQIDFEFEVFLTVDGSAAGIPFVFSGSFISDKEIIN